MIGKRIYMTFGSVTGWFEIIGVKDGVTYIKSVASSDSGI